MARGLMVIAARVFHPLTFTFPLLLALAVPSEARPASLSIDGGPVVLGRTTSAEVTLRVDEPPGMEALPLRLWVSAGTFGEPARVAPGVYRVAYEPPATRFPQLALVAAWKDAGAAAPVALLRLPLLGTARFSVKAPPGRAVTVQLEGGTFGPVAADESGEAVVAIVAPPGARRATVIVKGRAALTRGVDLDVPLERPFGAIALAGAESAGGLAARVLVLYEGDRSLADRVRLTASEGAVALEGETPGVLTYRYVPAAASATPEVRFEARLEGEPSAKATARLALGERAGAIAISSSNANAKANGPDFNPAGSCGAIGVSLSPPCPQQVRPGPTLSPAPRGRGRSEEPSTSCAPARQPSHPRDLAPARDERGQGSTDPGAARLLAGVRGGFAHDLAEPAGTRFGIDLWAPVRIAGIPLGLGLSATAGGATRTFRNGSAGTSQAAVLLAPLSVRLGIETWSSQRASVLFGVGYTSAWALVTSASQAVEVGWATGPLAFLAGGWSFGAGQAFVEVSVGSTPLALRAGDIEASGVALDVGYRVAVF